MLFLMHLTDRQSRLLRDHLDEDMTWSPGQVQCVESFPDLDTLARIFDGRRLRLELAVALRCALFSCSQYFVTVIGSASRRRGHKLIRESRGIHRVFLAAGDEHYIARVPRLLGFRFILDLAPGMPARVYHPQQMAIVVDMVEQGLDRATQETLIAHLRQRAKLDTRPLLLMTRSSSNLNLAAVGPDGYEAVATCLASPEVRARTAGVIAWRRQAS
jgi:hypothetical protein